MSLAYFYNFLYLSGQVSLHSLYILKNLTYESFGLPSLCVDECVDSYIKLVSQVL